MWALNTCSSAPPLPPGPLFNWRGTLVFKRKHTRCSNPFQILTHTVKSEMSPFIKWDVLTESFKWCFCVRLWRWQWAGPVQRSLGASGCGRPHPPRVHRGSIHTSKTGKITTKGDWGSSDGQERSVKEPDSAGDSQETLSQRREARCPPLQLEI